MSDTGVSGGIVLGTAGHIDHGKTALVRSLTGVDTDRLAEEKKRGISIELGFADLVLPDKRRIAIVDVPGHERFIKNMLAGATGIDAVLLVVAADEGIQPQTREHFDICRLLNIRKGIIAITKSDLVSPERLTELDAEVHDFCRNTFLEKAPRVAVSAQQGHGLKRLVEEITALVNQLRPRASDSFARLSVDRSFKMQGFGAVVTGTLQGGSLRTGDMVEIHPLRQQVRIRGLQVHRKPVGEAHAGQRTAINLAGIEAQQIQRGSVIAIPDTFESTTIFDATVQWLDPKHAARTRQALRLYIGCVDTSADVRLIHPVGSGRTLTRISTREPLLILPGDRFVIRNSEVTVAGGSVLDSFPPIRINRQKTSDRLQVLLDGSDAVRLRTLVEESTQGKKISNLVRLTGWTPEKIRRLTAADAALTLCEPEKRVIARAWLEQKRQQVIAWLENYHKANPGSRAVPMHQVRSSLMSGIEPTISDLVLSGIPEILVSADGVALSSHVVRTTPEERAARELLERMFLEARYQPPSPEQAFLQAELNPKIARAQLDSLLKDKRLVKVAPDILFHITNLEQLKHTLAARKGTRFSVPEFKEWTNVSRKYAIPLLEFLDRERVTRREGDLRIVL